MFFKTGKICKAIAGKSKMLLLCVLALLMVMGPMSVLASEENTVNYLLIGSDRRDDTWNGNSDSMILVTVNYDTHKLYLTSFMRDLYANVDGYGVKKLNFAYAIGGASKLEETLVSNYQVKIDNYIAVDFPTMAKIVDMLGGIDLYLEEEEISSVTGPAEWMYETYDLTPSGDTLSGSGWYHLDGAQVVSYSRIRYVGNNDYQRTERQRTVLDALRAKANALDVTEMSALIFSLLQMTDNDINILESAELVAVTQRVKDYEMVENRVPYDGMFTSQNEILVPTSMSDTIARLRSVIYADAGSETYIAAYSYGQNAAQIRAVQQALNDAGFDSGKVDGIWGGNTAKAITEYQEANGLSQTGMIDVELLESLGIEAE